MTVEGIEMLGSIILGSVDTLVEGSICLMAEVTAARSASEKADCILCFFVFHLRVNLQFKRRQLLNLVY